MTNAPYIPQDSVFRFISCLLLVTGHVGAKHKPLHHTHFKTEVWTKMRTHTPKLFKDYASSFTILVHCLLHSTQATLFASLYTGSPWRNYTADRLLTLTNYLPIRYLSLYTSWDETMNMYYSNGATVIHTQSSMRLMDVVDNSSLLHRT